MLIGRSVIRTIRLPPPSRGYWRAYRRSVREFLRRANRTGRFCVLQIANERLGSVFLQPPHQTDLFVFSRPPPDANDDRLRSGCANITDVRIDRVELFREGLGLCLGGVERNTQGADQRREDADPCRKSHTDIMLPYGVDGNRRTPRLNGCRASASAGRERPSARGRGRAGGCRSRSWRSALRYSRGAPARASR